MLLAVQSSWIAEICTTYVQFSNQALQGYNRMKLALDADDSQWETEKESLVHSCQQVGEGMASTSHQASDKFWRSYRQYSLRLLGCNFND